MAGWNSEVTSLDNSNDELMMRDFKELIYERFCIIFHMIVLGQLILHYFLYGRP